MKRAIRPIAYLTAGLFLGLLGGGIVSGAVDALAQSKTTVQIDARTKQQIKQELKVEVMKEIARERASTTTTTTTTSCDCNALQQQFRALERLYQNHDDVLKDLWRQVQDHVRDDTAWKKNTERTLTKAGFGKVRQN
jgi:hypothetical protein